VKTPPNALDNAQFGVFVAFPLLAVAAAVCVGDLRGVVQNLERALGTDQRVRFLLKEYLTEPTRLYV